MSTNAWFTSFLLLLALGATGLPAELWWERGAATWYYKDDWKALALTGARSFSKTFDIPARAASGWIVIWGDRGYSLAVNGEAVSSNIDGGLIDDCDLTPFLRPDAKAVTLRIDGDMVCAEGELVGRDGKRYPFATGEDWQAAGGGKLQAKKMEVGPSTGAFNRAHNGRLLAYNDEERGKTAIACCLARIHKLDEQGLFLMRRYRSARDILSFDPYTAWRLAERLATPLAERARDLLRTKAIPAQKAGRFTEAIAAAKEATEFADLADAAVFSAVSLFERQVNPALVGRFPDDRFAWLNARDLISNDPAAWPFCVSPSGCPYIDLAGQWDFRTDAKNEGEKGGWHLAGESGRGWRTLFVPMPWERQGVMEDNPNSPGDCPYPLSDLRCGDKPYNGFAWYRKRLLIPAGWRGRRVILAIGSIRNWARVFINGRPLGEGRLNPPSQHEIPPALLRPGEVNTITIQVYNHDNFGGIDGGPVALFADGSAPESRETPGLLAFVRECSHSTPAGPVRTTFYAGAMSPAVLVATDGPSLELWGWEAKGYDPPAFVALVGKQGFHKTLLAQAPDPLFDATALAENWLLLGGGEREVLIVLEQVPKSVKWGLNPQGTMGLTVASGEGPVRAAILCMTAGVQLDPAACRFWARALRRYPVSASELVRSNPAAGPLAPRTCAIRYNYFELGGWGLDPLTVAPVPMLFNFGLEHRYPGLRIASTRDTGYRSAHASYRVVEGTETVEYQIPALDRSKVKKGVGELFAKRKAEQNARGGVSEDEMFRRMADWGFDHCRYAWAFQADWDLPLVKHVGGPIIEDNEANWRRLDELVEKCNKAGMQMMLCWFFNEDQPQKDTGGAVRNSTRYWRAHPEAQKNAFELWRRIAARYADRPEGAIAYDFFNEPAYIHTDHWNEIIRELTKIIRSVDKRHLVVWESADGWAQPQWCLWMEPANDPNVLYSFHHYGKHWGYAYDEYYPSTRCTTERSQIDPWLDAILFGIQHHVPIHCGEFGISMIQPEDSGERWLDDYLAMFDRFGIGWNWWNYAGDNIYRTGLAAGNRISPYVPILRRWMNRPSAK